MKRSWSTALPIHAVQTARSLGDIAGSAVEGAESSREGSAAIFVWQPWLAGGDVVVELPCFEVTNGLPGARAGMESCDDLIAGAGQGGELLGNLPGLCSVTPALHGNSASEICINLFNLHT